MIAAGIATTGNAYAQCASAVTAGCGVYKSCFAKYCPCQGDPEEYFESYGLKYCERFLTTTNSSKEWMQWRDLTLLCLQEAIVPKLDISASPKCDCGKMKVFAFQTHVACYTKPGASICSLGLADISTTMKTIQIQDAFTKEGWSQMLQVTKICETTAPEDGRRTLWSAAAKILGLLTK